jgi:hypothetical protein
MESQENNGWDQYKGLLYRYPVVAQKMSISPIANRLEFNQKNPEMIRKKQGPDSGEKKKSGLSSGRAPGHEAHRGLWLIVLVLVLASVWSLGQKAAEMILEEQAQIRMGSSMPRALSG